MPRGGSPLARRPALRWAAGSVFRRRGPPARGPLALLARRGPAWRRPLPAAAKTARDWVACLIRGRATHQGCHPISAKARQSGEKNAPSRPPTSNVPPNRTVFLARRTSRRARGGSNTQPPAFCGSAGLGKLPFCRCAGLGRARLAAPPASGSSGAAPHVLLARPSVVTQRKSIMWRLRFVFQPALNREQYPLTNSGPRRGQP